MPRPVQRQHPRTGRARTEPAPSPAPRTPQAAVLGLQALAGNAATAHLIACSPRPRSRSPHPASPGCSSTTSAPTPTSRPVATSRHRRLGRALKLHPISTFLRDQGEALQRLGRSEEAAKMYEQYLASGPLTSDVPKYRSRIKKLRGQTIPPGEDDDEPEIKAIGKAGARDWFDRGQEAFQAKRFGKAAESFRQANRLWAKPEFIFNEASALEAGDHKRAAANAYEHYLVRNPGAKDEAEILEKIKQLRAKAPPQVPTR